ncbi:ArsR/SmtB family transcription factor [Terracoccus luteus]|uniref:DNA-binding transcriptional ArsR family regulator n=1 Tax=Terracoccus luteus TaxID=53356 RepID=A0A839PWW7_9MICO|nr:metalloregulator ArsR/SmtB family transcription factor [Terracoccus luteus]MBB2987819.1 DNA-binding transcriptional ArsR family regulator [Terracoccus luteus]MCP2173470.1 DNA-binding transcriptional ArsR family regulator [Terracoccus luteus]
MSLEVSRTSRLRATAHPLRLQMLSLLTGAELSAAEVARELDITQANASYHLRTLLAAGLLVVGSEESVRGGQAKRYRHPWDAPEPGEASGEASGDAPDGTSRGTSGDTSADPVADPTEADEEARLAYVTTLAAAVPARFAERQTGTGGVFADADLWVEPEVWQRVQDLVLEASRLVHASACPPRTEGAVRTNLTLAAFRLRDDARGAR